VLMGACAACRQIPVRRARNEALLFMPAAAAAIV
jgi:type IV secretory pathway TrbD component